MGLSTEISVASAPKRVVGRPFPKGTSGNPGGRPKDSVRAELYDMLREIRKGAKGKPKTERRLIVEAVVAEARAGNVQAFEAIANRIDGRPVTIDEQDRSSREQAPQVTVNILNVLGALPLAALQQLEAAALEAQARTVKGGDNG